jgi:hypothetical protein
MRDSCLRTNQMCPRRVQLRARAQPGERQPRNNDNDEQYYGVQTAQHDASGALLPTLLSDSNAYPNSLSVRFRHDRTLSQRADASPLR